MCGWQVEMLSAEEECEELISGEVPSAREDQQCSISYTQNLSSIDRREVLQHVKRLPNESLTRFASQARPKWLGIPMCLGS